MKMLFTMTLGELIQIVAFLISAFAIYNRLTLQIAEIKTQIAPIVKWWVDQVPDLRILPELGKRKEYDGN